jgi:DNA-binding MarR family transcriptional regulator
MPERPGVADVLRDYPRIYIRLPSPPRARRPHGRAAERRPGEHPRHLDAVDPTTLGRPAEHMGVTPGTMPAAVERLVKGGHVQRASDPADRRRVLLHLAVHGVRVRGAKSVLDPALVAGMLDQLDERQRAAALRGLRLLARGAESAQRGGARSGPRRRA